MEEEGGQEELEFSARMANIRGLTTALQAIKTSNRQVRGRAGGWATAALLSCQLTKTM